MDIGPIEGELLIEEARALAAAVQDERVRGRFRFCGLRPHFAERLAACGFELPPGFFEELRLPPAVVSEM